MNHHHISWSPGVTLDSIEQQVIEKALDFFKKNKTATAQALGISIRTLDNKLEKYRDDRRKYELSEEERKRNRDDFLARCRGNIPGQNQYAANAELQKRIDAANADRSETGLRMEPAQEAATQRIVPVSERAEVQGVLPKDAAGSGDGGARKGVSGADGKAGPRLSDKGERRASHG